MGADMQERRHPSNQWDGFAEAPAKNMRQDMRQDTHPLGDLRTRDAG